MDDKGMARPDGPGSHEPSPDGLGPSGFDPSRITAAERRMLLASVENARPDDSYGVDLRGAGAWTVARNLERKGLGHTEDGAPNGSSLPGLFFADAGGIELVQDYLETDESGWGCPLCGLHREHSHDL